MIPLLLDPVLTRETLPNGNRLDTFTPGQVTVRAGESFEHQGHILMLMPTADGTITVINLGKTTLDGTTTNPAICK